MSTNKEWRKENTLTTPSDRDLENKFRLDQTAPALNDTQTSEAMKELNITAFVERFPDVERRYADPPPELQKIGLISFVPAKGSKPNEQGIYGFAKLRGNYTTETEANERAEYLIRNIDSYHQIYHTYVGRPFPLTTTSEYSKEVSTVELQKEMSSSIREDVKSKREKEQKDIEEIRTREKELLADVAKTEENLDDYYTTLRVKKAQLVWTYSETDKKVRQMCALIAKARKEIEDLDRTHPELRNVYYNKYMDARKRANLPTDRQSMDDSFMRYLVEDLELPAVDAEYKRLFGETETKSDN